MTLSLQQLSPVIGAVVDGVDLRKSLGPTTLGEIQQALVKHHVLFFRNQPVEPAQQTALSRNFGPLQTLKFLDTVSACPEIIIFDNHGENPATNDVWHSDESCIEEPPLGAILTAKIVPPCGGDTCWMSAVAAYNALSAPFRAFLDGLTALHEVRKNYRVEDTTGDDKKWAEALQTHPPARHPVVRVHPVTGLKGLYVNVTFTTRIVELSKGESDAVLNYLYEHVTKPEFAVRWKWSAGDLVIWDNRLTQHYAIADYMPHRRVMHRVTILGDQPRGPADKLSHS